MKRLMLILIVLLIGLSACSDDNSINNDKENEKTNGSNDSQTTVVGSGNGIEEIGDISGKKDYFDEKNTLLFYDDLFNLENKIVLDFKIQAEELKKIEADYQKYKNTKCNIYRKLESFSISVTYPSGTTVTQTINDVGIRMKGNTTRHSFVDASGNMFSFSHFTLSFQETFDNTEDYTASERVNWGNDTARENRKNRTFFGLRSLEVKFNAEGDLSYARDIYASHVYRSYGIYAQNTTLGVMNFDIKSGSSSKHTGSLGVYKIYEPIDRIYVKRYFSKEENDGDLYKATWGSFRGMPDLNHKSEGVFGVDESSWSEQQSVSYDLKTNKTSSTQDDIRNLLYWINGSTTDLNSTLKNYFDEDYFITLMALMYLSGDWDNFMYDSNNYYLYFNNLNHLCYLMPYDTDKTFGIANNERDMDEIKPLDTMNYQGDDNRSRLLKKTIDIKDSALQKAYLAKISEIYKDVLDIDAFMNIYNKLHKHYKDNIEPNLFDVPTSFANEKAQKYYLHIIYGREAKTYMSASHAYGYSITIGEYFTNKIQTIESELG